METYDPKDLLSTLPKRRDVSPGCLHFQPYGCPKAPVVALNGDPRRMVPLSGDTLTPEDFDRYMLLPLMVLRHALELWPKGEPVTLERGQGKKMELRPGSYRSWVEVPGESYVELSGGSFRLRLYAIRQNLCYRSAPGNWKNVSRKRLEEELERREHNRKLRESWAAQAEVNPPAPAPAEVG